MADIIISESSNRNDILFGKWQAPLAALLEKEAEAVEQMAIAPKFFKKTKSTHWAESYAGMTGFEKFQPVPENADYPTTGFAVGPAKVIENVEWKNSYGISRRMVDDEDTIGMESQIKGFTTAWLRTQEEFFAQMLGCALLGMSEFFINGIKFDCTTADGKPAFSTGHKTLMTNESQGNAYSDEFGLSALSRMSTIMQNTKGERGEILAMHPDTILIPNLEDLKDEVLTVVGSEKKPGSSNNDYNPQYGNWNIIIWPNLNLFIGSEKPWVLMDSNYMATHFCAIWQQRVPLEVKSVIESNDVNRWKGYARFGGGFSEYRGMMVGGVSHGAAL